MKTLLLTLCISAAISAQNGSADKLNIVKTNVTAYAFKNINLTYERVIDKTFSVSVGFGTVPQGSVPFSGSFIKDTDYENVEVGMTNFTIEPRIYLGSGYGHGFYFAPYYRYTSVKIDNLTLNNNFNTGEVPVNISGTATGNSAGLMVGIQWFLGKSDNWILDLWLLGGHYGKGTGDFRGNSARPLTPDEQAELRENIADLDIPFVKYTTKVDANGADVNVDGPWAGIRSGLSFGYRF